MLDLVDPTLCGAAHIDQEDHGNVALDTPALGEQAIAALQPGVLVGKAFDNGVQVDAIAQGPAMQPLVLATQGLEGTIEVYEQAAVLVTRALNEGILDGAHVTLAQQTPLVPILTAHDIPLIVKTGCLLGGGAIVAGCGQPGSA